MKIKHFIQAYREQLSYLFFGVLTTIVNYGVFWLLDRLWQGRYVLVNNLITFIIATAFAYVTNKCFVFHSRSFRLRVVAREALSFLAARVFSFGIEEAGLYVAAYVLRLGRYWLGPLDGVMLSKIVLSFVAVVLNYFFSKFLVFTKRRNETDETTGPDDSACV